MPEVLSRTSFEPHRNTTFEVSMSDGAAVGLDLVEVTDKTPAGFDGEQFSLIFVGPEDRALHQRIYKLEHPDLGTIDLFLVPVGRRGQGRLYEAYFNLMAGSNESNRSKV